MKSIIVIFFKLVVSISLIAFVVHAFDVRGLAGQLSQIDIATIIFCIGMMVIVVPIQAFRWKTVLDVNGSHLPFPRILAIVLIGHFFSQGLPSSVGGDAMRVWCAYRAGLAPADAAATVLLDRIISLVGLLALALCGLPWLLHLVPDVMAQFAIVTVIAGGIGVLLVLAGLARIPVSARRLRAGYIIGVLSELMRRLTFSPRLLQGIVLSITGFVIFSFVVFQIARALGASLSFGECLVLVPPVLLVSAIPVSIAGWGVREGVMVVAMGFVGVEPAVAFGISILFGLTVAVASLPGGAIWLWNGESTGRLDEVVNFTPAAAEEQGHSSEKMEASTPIPRK